MEKFTELVLNLAGTQPNTPLTEKSKAHIQNRLKLFFDRHETPDHPPYSAMIERALNELNEKGGSTVSSISQFLKREFDGLPWAHSSLLMLNINKLCKSGDIALVCGDRYKLVGINHSLSSSSKDKNKPSVSRKRKWSRVWDTRPKRKSQKRAASESDEQSCDEDELAEKNRESGIQEQKITANVVNYVVKREDDTNRGLPSRDGQDDLSSEIPPGFEAVVKNSTFSLTNDYWHPQEEASVVGGEEMCESKRGLRQIRCWNTKHPHSKELTDKTDELKISDVRSPVDRENRRDAPTEQQIKPEGGNYRLAEMDAEMGFKQREIKTYQRRRRANLPKTEAVNGDFLMKCEKLVDLPLLKDQEELNDFQQPHLEISDQKNPCGLQQQNLPRRSLRDRNRRR